MLYPIIETVEIKSKFRYLWLKYVNGVNLNVHCAGCLKGSYSKEINPSHSRLNGIELSEFEAKYFYLCGVASPYKWENNFHLAFEQKNNSIIDINENGIKIKILNAERLIIMPIDFSNKSKYKDDKAYFTCRNWQFANQISKNLLQG